MNERMDLPVIITRSIGSALLLLSFLVSITGTTSATSIFLLVCFVLLLLVKIFVDVKRTRSTRTYLKTDWYKKYVEYFVLVGVSFLFLSDLYWRGMTHGFYVIDNLMQEHSVWGFALFGILWFSLRFLGRKR